MLNRGYWDTALALRTFWGKAQDCPEDSLDRNGWAVDPDDAAGVGHDQSEVASIYAGVIAKIPAGATKVLDLGCGDGAFYRALKAAKPSLGYLGLDLVPENIRDAQSARGTVTVAGVQGGDTVTIAGITLTASGSQSNGGLDFNEAAGTDEDVAASLAAAINAAANGLAVTVRATQKAAVVTVWAAATGTAGDSIALGSSTGTRLAVSGATLAGGVAPGSFVLGNLWEYLAEATVDWDFIVSIGTALAYTDKRHRTLLLDLIDAKAPKGFVLLAAKKQVTSSVTERMTGILAASTNVAASYHEGTRNFLADALLKDLAPIYIHRESTSATAPTIPAGLRHIATGRFNQVLGRATGKRDAILGKAIPTEFKGIEATGGLVTGTATKTLDAEWVRGVRILNLGIKG